MSITRLIYASIARENLSISELMQIRKQAKVYNAEHDITGLLCCGGGFFLQLLEGPRPAVNALYARIQRDSRHSHLEILSYTTSSKRECGDWGMMMISVDEPFALARRAVLAAYSKDMRFSPLTMSRRNVLAMLRDLAKAEREHSASLELRVTPSLAPKANATRKKGRGAKQAR